MEYVNRGISHVRKVNGHISGILTGNLQPIAEIRLQHAGIEEYFITGGYGSDAWTELRLESLEKASKDN